MVNFAFDTLGAKRFGDATRDNVGRRMAVVYVETKSLAEGEACKGQRTGNTCVEESVISDATIQSVLSSRFRITGLQSAEAHELALLLRSGALAAPQTIVEQRSVGPSLGQDNIVSGMRALAFGAVLTTTDIGSHVNDAIHLGNLGVIFPFLLAALLKTAQGSSSVAVITAASIVFPLLPALGLDSDMGRLLCMLADAE